MPELPDTSDKTCGVCGCRAEENGGLCECATCQKTVCHECSIEGSYEKYETRCLECQEPVTDIDAAPVDAVVEFRSAWEIAEAWYDEVGIAKAISESGSGGFGSWDRVPEDVHSREFAKWLTHQYRLALSKGVQLGRSGSED